MSRLLSCWLSQPPQQMWASGCPWCKAPLGAGGPWAAFAHRAPTTLECSAAWGHQQPLMPGRCWPGLGTTSPARAALHAGICPPCQAPCWHRHCPTAVPVRGVSPGLPYTLELLWCFAPESRAVPPPSSCRSVCKPLWNHVGGNMFSKC